MTQRMPTQTDSLFTLLVLSECEGSLDLPFSVRSGKVPTRSERAIPQHPNHLQVIIDIRYQCAMMGPLSRHDSSACPPRLWRSQIPALSERRVPCEPCSPDTLSF